MLRERRGIDVIIANGENSAGGSGITPKTAEDIFSAGVNVITSGDHLWDQKEVTVLMAEEPRFLRPLNYPAGTIGNGSGVFRLPGLPPIGVLNLQGRVFMAGFHKPFFAGAGGGAQIWGEKPIIILGISPQGATEKKRNGRGVGGPGGGGVGT